MKDLLIRPLFKPVLEGRTPRVRPNHDHSDYIMDSVPKKYNCKSVREKCKRNKKN